MKHTILFTRLKRPNHAYVTLESDDLVASSALKRFYAGVERWLRVSPVGVALVAEVPHRDFDIGHFKEFEDTILSCDLFETLLSAEGVTLVSCEVADIDTCYDRILNPRHD